MLFADSHGLVFYTKDETQAEIRVQFRHNKKFNATMQDGSVRTFDKTITDSEIIHLLKR